MTARRAVSCLRQVTKPVRVKRRWPHHLRQSLKVRADSDASIARQARFVTAAVFVVAPLGAMHNPRGNFQHPLESRGAMCYKTRSFLTNAVLETGGESSGGIARCRRCCFWRLRMLICYVDESGDTGALVPSERCINKFRPECR